MDHDQRFKVLLQTFFREFIELFFAAWAGHFDFEHVTWLDKEAFPDPPRGERRVLDLVARLPVMAAPQGEESPDEWLILVHIEIEAEERAADLRRRIFDYWKALRARHGIPVLSIGFFLRVGLDGTGWDVYREELWGEEMVRFRYPYIGLPALDGEEYVNGGNALGAALAVLMNLPEDRRLELGREAFLRVQSEENEYRRFLLLDCIDAYLPRTDAESQAFEQLVITNNEPGVRAMTTGMFERHRQAGKRESVLRVLDARFGSVPEEVKQNVASAPAERLDDLLRAAATASSLQEFAQSE